MQDEHHIREEVTEVIFSLIILDEVDEVFECVVD
jgi:hypothetical protein